jgi:hypothetical protein
MAEPNLNHLTGHDLAAPDPKSDWAHPGRSRLGRPDPVRAGRTSSHILGHPAVIRANPLRLLPVCCQIRCSPKIYDMLGGFLAHELSNKRHPVWEPLEAVRYQAYPTDRPSDGFWVPMASHSVRIVSRPLVSLDTASISGRYPTPETVGRTTDEKADK